MNHPKTIERYNGTPEELVEDIGNLDYDALVNHFELLVDKFNRDSKNDMNLNHPQVSEILTNISDGLKNILENDVKSLADLCRGYNQRGEK